MQKHDRDIHAECNAPRGQPLRVAQDHALNSLQAHHHQDARFWTILFRHSERPNGGRLRPRRTGYGEN